MRARCTRAVACGLSWGASLAAGVLSACTPASLPPAPPPPPVVVAASPAPPAEPPPPSVEDAESAVRLLQALCEAAESEDPAFVVAHAILPLRGQERGDVRDEPHVHGLIADSDPETLRHRAVCEKRAELPSALADFHLDADRVRGFATLGGQRYRLTFEREPPRLVEQTAVLADVPLPPRAPTERSILVTVVPRSDNGSIDGQLAEAVEAALSAHPNCIEEQAKREPIGLSMGIRVETGRGPVADVDLYASTLGPVRYVGCLQAQLRPLLQGRAAGQSRPMVIDLWAMVGIAVSADELDPDANVLMVGPAEQGAAHGP